MTDKNTLVAGSMYLVNFLQRKVRFQVRYTVRYYLKSDMPGDMQPVVCRPFFDMVNVPSLPKAVDRDARTVKKMTLN